MIVKEREKELAIKLRRQGRTYREILMDVQVAKSTLSLWLREVGLSKSQKQRITQKRLRAGLRGAMVKKQQRIDSTNIIKASAKRDVKHISKRELWLIGVALYWAEGDKEKTWSKSSMLRFGNSDPNMVKVYIKWLLSILSVDRSQINFRIALHTNNKHRLLEIEKYWLNVTGFSKKYFQRVTYKKHNPKTNRKNIEANYFGLLNVNVKRSTALNRKVAGWVEGIVDACSI